jgi:type II secretory pathway component PulF
MPGYRIKILTKENELEEYNKNFASIEELKESILRDGNILVDYKVKKSRGYFFLKIISSWKKIFNPGKISDDDIYNLFYELGKMLKAGVPILDAVKMVNDSIRKEGLKKLLNDTIFQLKEGRNFSGILSENSKLYNFTPIVPVIQMGERTGRLWESFLEISSSVEGWVKIKNEITNALIYPVILLSTSFIAIYIILTYVIPKFEDIIKSFGVALPIHTRILFTLSVFLDNNKNLIAVIFILILACFLFLLKNEKFKRIINDSIYKIPVIRKIKISAEIIKFLNSLSNLLSGGVPILLSLDLASENFGSSEIRIELKKVSDNVKKGDRLADSLKDTEIFPDIVANFIKVGENSGCLPEVLHELYDMMSEKFLKKIKRYMNLLEPLIIIFVALFVGFIVITFIPIIVNLSDINF